MITKTIDYWMDKVKTRLWVDDVRPAPNGYVWCRSVNDTRFYIEALDYAKNEMESVHLPTDCCPTIDLIDIDHDAGIYAVDGGDYIKLLDWFEETGRNYPIHIHSMNPVGVENMRRIIRRNGWKEIT